jgi:phosphoribosylamine---glycine ligase
MKMKVLVLGKDGRAHAMVWKLFNSPLTEEILCLPGNGGTGQLALQADVDTQNIPDLAHWAFRAEVDTIVPIATAPIRDGLVEEAQSFRINVFGPPPHSVRLEESRCYAKEFLLQHGLPTAEGRAFTSLATAERYLAAQPLPIVVKADHRAVGEGIYHDRYTALTALKDLFAVRPVEGHNNGVVIESFLPGTRVSMSAITDGHTTRPLLPTWIYDRLGEGGKGEVAPAMGAHTSASTYAQKLAGYMHQNLIQPLVAALHQDQVAYQGILGVDCIITDRGPRITGLRCTMRDMESQVVLPRLEDDILPLIQAAITGRLEQMPALRWRDEASVGIALVAQGYPHHFPMGSSIEGLELLDEGILVFHDETHSPLGLRYDPSPRGPDPLSALIMGTGGEKPPFSTTGGHVLCVVALAATLNGARGKAVINAERITFTGSYFRGDIGMYELK